MKIVEDIRQYSKGSILRAISTIIFNPNFHCVALYRIAHQIHKVKLLTVISKLIMYINRILYSVDIDYRADLGGGFVLVHGIGIVIGKNVKTEANVKIYQGVTLGGSNNKKKEIDGFVISQPYIKENVTIYANSTLIGPIVIGRGATIGANSIVSKDVEEGQTIYMRGNVINK